MSPRESRALKPRCDSECFRRRYDAIWRDYIISLIVLVLVFDIFMALVLWGGR